MMGNHQIIILLSTEYHSTQDRVSQIASEYFKLTKINLV